MKQRNESTLNRYRLKCEEMKQTIAAKNIGMAEAAKIYKGSWYLYTYLEELGYLVRGKDDKLSWKGGVPDDKTLWKLIAYVNAKNKTGHEMRIKERMAKRGRKPKSLQGNQIPKAYNTGNATVNMFLQAIMGHCETGNVKAVVKLSHDLKKVI